MKGDERILGNGDYVLDVLKKTGELFERRYELKARCCHLDMLARGVAGIFHVRSEETFRPGKYKERIHYGFDMNIFVHFDGSVRLGQWRF